MSSSSLLPPSLLLQAVATMVEECCKFVDQTPDLNTKLSLIDTLRTVSEGKVKAIEVG